VYRNPKIFKNRHGSYYPFGLQQKGISLEAQGNLHNWKNTFQKQEFNEDLGVDVYEFKYRMDDPQIGRFWSIDPLADKYVYNSTYAFSENKLTGYVELEGLEAIPIGVTMWATQKVVQDPNSGTSKAIGAVVGVGQSVVNTITGVGNVIAHPIETVKGLGELNTPMGQVKMGLSIAGKVDAYNKGTGFEKSAILSEAITDVATAVVGTKGVGNIGKGAEIASLTGETTTLFRAASTAEVVDMTANGVRNVSTGYETGKLFATSASDAAQFGKNNFGLDGIPNTVVPIQVPNSVMKTTTTFTADGMPAVSIPATQLPALKPLPPLNYSPKPTNPYGNAGW
jgi:RHS repeat-associated protein